MNETGIIVNCTNCGEGALLPHSKPGMVSIESLCGWTYPPLRCPKCSSDEMVALGKERQ